MMQNSFLDNSLEDTLLILLCLCTAFALLLEPEHNSVKSLVKNDENISTVPFEMEYLLED